MRNALSELHELAQKQIIPLPEYFFTVSGNDHEKIFACTIKLDGFKDVAAQSSGKSKAKRKAAALLLDYLKANVDLTKKPEEYAVEDENKNQAIKSVPGYEGKNPISALMELSQQGIIAPAHYESSSDTCKKQIMFKCVCKIDALSTEALNINKQQAKQIAATKMLSLVAEKGLLLPSDQNSVSIKPKITAVTDQNAVSWLMEAKQVNHIKNLKYRYESLSDARFKCICEADAFETEAEATAKKTAKLLASEKMMALMNEHGYNIGQKTFKQNYLVEPNACSEWIQSICPSDVDVKRLSWYLDNDCVVINLGLKKDNPIDSVNELKRQIQAETNLLVLVNRYRDAKKAIESLQRIAENDGYIYDLKAINRIALGHYFKHREHPEPIINWQGRHDHTKDHCFTIDSRASVDLDDAFSIDSSNPDAIVVHVHIADVSNLVPEASKEDLKALSQCFTYYGASKQLPMIANQTMYQASLLPHKDRMAWTIKMILTAEAEISEYKIYPSVIRSKFRLDQKSIGALTKDNVHQHSEDFKILVALSDKLLAKRLAKGGVNSFSEETSGYLLVQEFMLLANRYVAEFCIKNKIAIPFRVHRFPDDSVDIQKIYNQTENHSALLPFLGRASYNVIANSHEALAFDCYCHFTSPIRRYADLVVQRQIKRFYFGEQLKSQTALESSIEQINRQEQLLEMSETTIRYVERLQVQFRQAGHRLETVVEAVEDDYYRLKALSVKCDYALRLPKSLYNEPLAVGHTVFVVLLGKYHVINECFDCEPV